MNTIMSVIRTWAVNRQLAGNAKKELEAAQRASRQTPCGPTADDLKVASDCQEFLNHRSTREHPLIEDAEPLRQADGE